MNQAALSLLLALAAPADPTRIVSWLVVWALAALSLGGLALIVQLLFPMRVPRAAELIASTPLRSWLLGALMLSLPLGALALLFHYELRIGRGMLALAVVASVVLGLAVAAMELGRRGLPQAAPGIQGLLGLLALTLALICPLGIPVALVAVPLGLGAFLASRRP